MIVLPAIDLYEGKAVRLYKGDYNQMTVYDPNPSDTALKFKNAGAEWIHMVDLEGARNGLTPNREYVKQIIDLTGLKVEIGGGIRSMAAIDSYMNIGVSRVILGTSAITDEALVRSACLKYPGRIAAGADIKDGYIAIKGWTETSDMTIEDFCRKMQELGIETIICTDISRDGVMQGTNRELYRRLGSEFSINFIASGGVSNLEDVASLRDMGLYGAIIGKAYYTGAINLEEAIRLSAE